MVATITYLGGPETGNVDKLEWGGVTFEKDKPFKVDLRGKNANQKGTLNHILAKARTNRFFHVEGEVDKAETPAKTEFAPAKPAMPVHADVPGRDEK